MRRFEDGLGFYIHHQLATPPKSHPTSLVEPCGKCGCTKHKTLEYQVGTTKCLWCDSTKHFVPDQCRTSTTPTSALPRALIPITSMTTTSISLRTSTASLSRTSTCKVATCRKRLRDENEGSDHLQHSSYYYTHLKFNAILCTV